MLKVQIHQLTLKCLNEDCVANKEKVCMNTFTNLERFEGDIDFSKCYNKVYEFEITEGIDNVDLYLEELFKKLNINHPEDYKARSLSTSDIIQIEDRYFMCQDVGFKEIDTDFNVIAGNKQIKHIVF